MKELNRAGNYFRPKADIEQKWAIPLLSQPVQQVDLVAQPALREV
jgi:hypothetical protein